MPLCVAISYNRVTPVYWTQLLYCIYQKHLFKTYFLSLFSLWIKPCTQTSRLVLKCSKEVIKCFYSQYHLEVNFSTPPQSIFNKRDEYGLFKNQNIVIFVSMVYTGWIESPDCCIVWLPEVLNLWPQYSNTSLVTVDLIQLRKLNSISEASIWQNSY